MKTNTNNIRPKILHQRRVRKGVGTGCRINCINTHEELISSALKSTSQSLNKVNDRFTKFHHQCNDKAQSQENIEWLRLYNGLNEEAVSMSKSFDNAVKLIVCHDDFIELSSFLRENMSDSYKVELSQRLSKVKTLLGNQSCCGASINTDKEKDEENICNIRSGLCEQMEFLQKRAESLEAQIQGSLQDITPDSTYEETMPQEFIVDLEGLNYLCLCFNNSNMVHDEFKEDISCAIRGIVKDYKIKLSDRKMKKEGMVVENDGHQRESRRRELISTCWRQIQDLRKQIVEGACEDVVSRISNDITNEQQYRHKYLVSLQELSQRIANDKIKEERLRECEQERVNKEKKNRERTAAKHVLEEYHNLKNLEKVEQLKEEEERSRAERKERKERLTKNSKRYSTSTNQSIEHLGFSSSALLLILTFVLFS